MPVAAMPVVVAMHMRRGRLAAASAGQCRAFHLAAANGERQYSGQQCPAHHRVLRQVIRLPECGPGVDIGGRRGATFAQIVVTAILIRQRGRIARKVPAAQTLTVEARRAGQGKMPHASVVAASK